MKGVVWAQEGAKFSTGLGGLRKKKLAGKNWEEYSERKFRKSGFQIWIVEAMYLFPALLCKFYSMIGDGLVYIPVSCKNISTRALLENLEMNYCFLLTGRDGQE